MSRNALLTIMVSVIGGIITLGAQAQTGKEGTSQKPAASTHQSSNPAQPKLCVADIANSSMTGIKVYDLKDRWLEELKKQNLNAEWASTATVVAKSLALSGNNRDSIKLRKCDYLLLAEVDNPNLKPGQGKDAKLDLVFNYALFKAKSETLVKEGTVPVPSPEKATDAVIAVVPEAAAQVGQAMHKK